MLQLFPLISSPSSGCSCYSSFSGLLLLLVHLFCLIDGMFQIQMIQEGTSVPAAKHNNLVDARS